MMAVRHSFGGVRAAEVRSDFAIREHRATERCWQRARSCSPSQSSIIAAERIAA